MSKEVVEIIRRIFHKGKYYLGVDCTIDSLVRLDRNKCRGCVLLDTIDTVKVMCPLMMKREVNISNISNNSGMFLK